MQCCTAVMTTSGTTTLELALLTIPMVICYKLAPITYWLGRRLIKIPIIGLPNIIAHKAIIKELIQHEASAENLAEELWQLLTNTDYANTQRQELRYVKEQLGNGGASALMAQLALEMLHTA
jgi:lipid-A-disaccharide synthase